MLTQEQNASLTRVGAGTPMGELMRRYWHPVAASVELKERAVKEVRILGEDLVLFKDRSGSFGLIDRVCAHRRVDLAYGIPEEHGLRCMYHGWMYDHTGQCIEQPFEETVHPDGRFKEKVKIKGYPVRELGGLLFAYLGPEPVPHLPPWRMYWEKNAIRTIGYTVLPCNWLQCQENSLDPVHVEWLHGHFGQHTQELLGKQLNERRLRELFRRHERIGFEIFDHGVYKKRLMEDGSEEDESWRLGHPMLFPNMLSAGVGGQTRVPIDDTHTLNWHYSCWIPEPGIELPEQDEVPLYEHPLKGQDGRFSAGTTIGQDNMAWVLQGPILERDRERLGASDEGLILFRHLLEEQLKIVEDGGDPMNVFRDPAPIGLHVPTEQTSFGRREAPGVAGDQRERELGAGALNPLNALIEEYLARAKKVGVEG